MKPAYNAAVLRVRIPTRIAQRLEVSDEGWPVPWFVARIDGKPDFRIVDTPKVKQAYEQKLCWICGDRLGRNAAMTIGPMCTISRCISEPPSHRECAIFAAQACPFLANPRTRRNSRPFSVGVVEAPGETITRNPGAVAVWITRGYRAISVPKKHADDLGVLFEFDDPEEVMWFAEGRTATRAEVEASINSGFYLLEAEAAKHDAAAVAELHNARKVAEKYLPDANGFGYRAGR